MYQVTQNSTQHNAETPHGFKTPHRFPVGDAVARDEVFMKLVRQLYPTGRAFHIPELGVWENFHRGINVSFLRLINDAIQTIDSTLPDNDNFSLEDATLYEFRLGLLSSPNTTLENRKLAIKRKMAHPSNIKARQHPKFIEYQLQLAGFDVYIHENGFYDDDGNLFYKTPSDITGDSTTTVQHGNGIQHGTQHGFAGFEVIANTIQDEVYAVGDDNLWPTFFISGELLGEGARVAENRKREFKELVLKLKPAHTVAFTFIEYI